LLLDAGRVSVRILLDSQDSLLEAQNAVTSALINHQIAILNFFNDIGLLKVKPDGMWEQEKEWQITKTEDKEAITAEVSQDL